MRPVFIKHFLRGSVQCLPYLGDLLDEIIFGVLDEESAQAESEKIHEKLDGIVKALDHQEGDFAEILLALHIQTDVNEELRTKLEEIEKSVRDTTARSLPEYFEKALDTVIGGNKQIYAELQKQAEQQKLEHKRQSLEHKQIGEKLDETKETVDEIKGNVNELIEKVDLVKIPDKQRSIDSLIQNMPYTSIGNLFKGRGNDFDKLKDQLGDKSQATAITQEQKDRPEAIYGLGGIGKTRLAVEFGWYALEQLGYKAVLFLNCGQELYDKDQRSDPHQEDKRDKSAVERLYAEMAKLGSAELLDIPGCDAMLPEAAYHQVIKELQSREDWLIVFDNVDGNDICNAVKGTLPKLKRGKVIITSRLANWTGDIKPLELKKLSLDASIDYLLQKTADKRPPADNDAEKVKELAQKLDGLPVALEQAAAYIIYESITFQQYLKDFHDIKLDVLGFEAKNLSLADYPEPVLRTWALTEQRLTAHARAVLTISAFLSPDNIPESLLLNQSNIVLAISGVLEQITPEEFQSRLNGHGDARAVRRAMAQLKSYSMISRNTSDETFSIHRLVQEVARVRLSDTHKELFAQLILTMIHNDCPDYPTAIKTNFSWHKVMDTHISAIIAFTKRLWRAISAIPKAVAGPLATQINNLATFYQNQARFYEAEPLMKRALKIDEASLGKTHPDVARDLNNLAMLYKATNRLKEAEPLLQRVVKISENSLGETHPNLATALNNLAQLYQDTNRPKEAEPLMQRALNIDEASLGKDHPNVARDLNNLAQLYKATNRLKEAEPLMKRALKMDEASLGKDHPNVAIALNNLAALYQAANRLKEAEPLMKRALKIDEASLGKDHPTVATRLNNLAALYQAANRLKEAEPLMERDLVIFLEFTRRTGHPHPHLEAAINNYSALLMQMGHSEAQVAARLKRLAPEMSEPPDNQPKEQ